MDNWTQKKKAEVLKHLESSVGVITVACQKAGLARSTFYFWRDEDPEFDAAVLEIRNEFAVDFAESQLLNNMKAGRETSIIFFLKTRGRHRGYGQDEQVVPRNSKPPVEWVDETDEDE